MCWEHNAAMSAVPSGTPTSAVTKHVSGKKNFAAVIAVSVSTVKCCQGMLRVERKLRISRSLYIGRRCVARSCRVRGHGAAFTTGEVWFCRACCKNFMAVSWWADDALKQFSKCHIHVVEIFLEIARWPTAKETTVKILESCCQRHMSISHDPSICIWCP